MAVGCFLGIVPSYADTATALAHRFIGAINSGLASRRLTAYSEPLDIPNVYVDNLFGRSALDHESAGFLAALGDTPRSVGLEAPNLSLLSFNPYRVAFVPGPSFLPFETEYVENIAGDDVPIWAGSLQGLLDELLVLAPHLAIPLSSQQLAGATATKINDCVALSDADPLDPADGRRSAWLLLHEGARLALSHGIAICLAG